MYGKHGLIAIEVKASRKVDRRDLRSLLEFRKDYPKARCYLLYGGSRRQEIEGIDILPAVDILPQIKTLLG